MSKVALVTGGGKGIGRAIALQLAKDGMDVAVIDINKENMDTVVKEVEALGQKATGFMAAYVSFLAGPGADYITGQAPIQDGGIVYI